jgi:septal ring factor EnvC (AmiA/AmiB activator)
MKSKKSFKLLMLPMMIAVGATLALAQGTPQHQQQMMQQRTKQIQAMQQWVVQFQDRVHHINQSFDQSVRPGHLSEGQKGTQYQHMAQINQSMSKMADEMKLVVDNYGLLVKSAEDANDPKALANLDRLREALAELTAAFDETQESYEPLISQAKTADDRRAPKNPSEQPETPVGGGP